MCDINRIRKELSGNRSWEDRYRYIIRLGEALPPLDADEKSDTNMVDGCMTSVWLSVGLDEKGYPEIRGDSDSVIVKGLIAILARFYSCIPADRLAEADVMPLFSDLGLETHLSPGRKNGLSLIDKKIRSFGQHLRPSPLLRYRNADTE